jgi:Domain of unknown function (DUF6431)
LPKITGQLSESHPEETVAEKLYSLPVGFISGGGAPLPAQILAGQRRPAEPQWTTILFIPLSAPLHKLETHWARDCDKIILRRCPACERDSIIGHGRRSKQAHDEHHDWIGIRRGRCLGCGKTFTFLPLLSLPYTHYSLLARCQTLRRRFVEHCSWEEATPTLKDSNCVPDPSTLRRWSSGLECSEPAASFLRQTVARLAHWLMRGDQGDHQGDRHAWLASWLTPVLQTLWPLRL